MKKILLLVVLDFCFTTTFCQSYYKIYSSSMGVWNTNTKLYEWQPEKHSEMILTLKGSIVLINDQANSTYVIRGRTYHNEDDNSIQWIWNATDEENRVCSIKLVYLKKNGLITTECQLCVYYVTVAFRYDVTLISD